MPYRRKPWPTKPHRAHYDSRWRVVARQQVLSHPVCEHCGAVEDLTADHVVPVAAGGNADRENLQTLCRSCNGRKRDRLG